MRAGVERQRVQPDLAQARANGRVAQVFELDAVGTRVGERRVGRAAAAEFGIQLDDVADIDNDQKRRPRFFCRQGARVVLGLGAAALHAVVEALGLLIQFEFFRFQHEAGAPVGVDAALGTAAVAMPEDDPPLEHIGVVARVGTGRVGHRHVEQFTQFAHKTLRVGEFGTVGVLPAGDEGFGGHGVWRHHKRFTP